MARCSLIGLAGQSSTGRFKQKSPGSWYCRGFGMMMKNPGNVLLSHQATLAVPSALEGLTAVFGMGTGVTPPPWSPG